MFNEIDGGFLHDIQDLPCWTPRRGLIWDYDANKWVDDTVHRRDPNRFANCYWQVDPRFGEYKAWKEEEERRQKQDPKFVHAKLAKFIEDCWRWRLGGYWFYNNDVPTYITGLHWYYLSVYNIVRDPKDGVPEYAQDLPDYRDEDRKTWYAWEYADEDPLCMGLNLVMNRRAGKTYIASCIAIEKSTRRKKAHVGIQSKSTEDAREVFQKGIIEPFRRLPFFFQPVSDIPRDKTPAKVLNLKSGKMSLDVSDELGSKIDYLSSAVKAYDGKRLIFYIDDECGKNEECDVLARYNVVKNCLVDNTRKVVGKSIHTTTVDEMEAGGSAFFRMWKGSRQTERTALGTTKTRLFNYFVPAQYMGEADQYGYAYHEKNLMTILAEREAETDQRSLASMKRQFPTNEREAFSADATSCVFSNINGLNLQLDNLKFMPPRYERGNFAWLEGVFDTRVEWIPDDKGKFLKVWEPHEDHLNLKVQRFGKWHPLNTDQSCAGCDPYNHKFISVDGEKSMSKGALAIVKKENVLAPSDLDEGPALFYMNRPGDPAIFYEDVLMACVYYGCQVLIEYNKDKCIDHFYNRGYDGYIAYLPGKTTPGISSYGATSGGTSTQIATLLDSYITHHIETCYIPELVEQFLDFDVTETTKFDGVMAFGFAKILQKLPGAGNQRPKSDKQPDIKDILPAGMLVDGGRSMFGF